MGWALTTVAPPEPGPRRCRLDDDEPTVTTLVAAALEGDEVAWSQLVDRYTPLMVSVLRRYGLSQADVEDVSQIVLLRLVEHLGELREPRALPSWLLVTTRNECIRLLRSRRRVVPVAATDDRAAVDRNAEEPDERLMRAELSQAVLEALAELSERDRTLLLLLSADPPLPYKEIARRLGMPVGSIGPTRARALDKLRSSSALAGLSGSDSLPSPTGGGSEPRDVAAVGRR
jgi:RNA polymerase sigma factor (sigma-70 family)